MHTSRMVRKVYAKRRHKNNWFGMTHILKGWVMFFLKNKQFVRFYQNLGLFRHQLHSTSINLFSKQYVNLGDNGSLNTFACSNRILSFFINPHTNTLYNSPLKQVTTSGLLTPDLSHLEDVSVINPGLVRSGKVFAPYNDNALVRKNDNMLFIHILTTQFTSVLRFITILYSVCILLTLFQVCREPLTV